MGAKRSKQVATENSTELKRKSEKEDIVDTIFTGAGAAEMEARPKIEAVKSAVRKRCVFQYNLFNDFEDEYKLDIGSVLTEKVNMALEDSPYSNRSAEVSPALIKTCFQKAE